MPSIDEWRLKNGKIESLSDALIKVETHVYKGLSGSILLFWDGNRHYAIGVTVGVYITPSEGYVDMAVATRLTDKVIAEIEKKAASFNK